MEFLYSALSENVVARRRGIEGSKTEAFMGISGCPDGLGAHRPISGYTPFDIPIAITLDK